MTALRSTVIVKTDICGFTTRVKTLSESELSSLLDHHKAFISDIVAKNAGSIVKGEGDSFWIIFPSVTTAVLAAVEMQQELRLAQLGQSDDERLAIRIVIALGDVLHQDQDIFGDTVNLTARIESATPPDEIYLSQAAWLALNKAEVQTVFVNEFPLKGITEPVRVYRVEQKHKTRIIKNQILVFTDISDFTRYTQSHSVKDVENLLVFLDILAKRVCEENGGVIRQIMGDSYFMTFENASHALAAMARFCTEWDAFVRQNQIACGQRIGIHRGDFYMFRSCTYSGDINIASGLGRLLQLHVERDRAVVLASETVKDEVTGTIWENKLWRLEKKEVLPQAVEIFEKLAEKTGIYQLVVQ
jgi:class 3 adenylate cyclase